MTARPSDADWMQRCIGQAEIAGAGGEVPVGAAVVRGTELLAVGHNSSIALHDPTAHAEIVALRGAAARIGNYRIADAVLFVTVEPCIMCVGAALQARVRRIVFGCRDPKGGALGSIADFSNHPALNHRFEVTAGVCEEEARRLLQEFFQHRRLAKDDRGT
jgi:tRNA(adenine34) deaminase